MLLVTTYISINKCSSWKTDAQTDTLKAEKSQISDPGCVSLGKNVFPFKFMCFKGFTSAI